jgi:hypothetical protein
MTARKANPTFPPNPEGKGLSCTPQGLHPRENRDLVDNLTIALEVPGGKRLMVPRSRVLLSTWAERARPRLASWSRGAMLQIGRGLQSPDRGSAARVSDRPVAGVIASPVAEHVQVLEASRLPLVEEVIDAS